MCRALDIDQQLSYMNFPFIYQLSFWIVVLKTQLLQYTVLSTVAFFSLHKIK